MLGSYCYIFDQWFPKCITFKDMHVPLVVGYIIVRLRVV